MDYIYSVLEFIGGVGSHLLHFIFSIPDMISDVFAYGWYWLIKLYLYTELSTIELAYKIATMLLQDYEIYDVLSGLFNQLSPDLRHLCYSLGIVDGIRMIIDAFATAFVLRFMEK
ncbi:DUF2523 family protein [Vibrio neptunius]|uniref:DUF2523 domain-containing protein n=2 Tax=Vibrio neptunius TaxID=170651 RepID=A0ABS3A8V6_9VIBR|nr:DUF2523 family protein [Vibrio neptunius]MBN3495895.1 DUF2523 domain-containing protein [Vibrio neptunius]MBN3518296.1 DUF2523 domain-containing protein [Vibrio neptunius]MBN3552631.1 DUF2523 domain-containing protein [Vibrio neptunius]MBN3580684.1 DUF2523 domain-containing protein [Vibrio neptunius]MCH9874350.1 DUF2523 domain-containing protein [Vibrio neptunius]